MTLPRVVATARTRSASLPFAALGIVFGTWAARIPAVQLQAGLDEGALGLALLGSAVGLVASALTAGAVVRRIGAHRATLVGTAALGAVLVLPGLGVGLPSLAAALLLMGAASGLMDVAMNAWAADIEIAEVAAEAQRGRSGGEILGACHGLFSLGGMAGAGIGAGAAALGVSPAVHFAAVGVGAAGLVVAQGTRHVGARVPVATEDGGPLVSLPTGPIAGLAGLAFCALVVEGAVADWSAVFLADVLGAGPARAALGFAAFSAAMAGARFASDPLTVRLGGPGVGDRRLVRGGAALGALGLAVAVAASGTAVSVVGFGILGLGIAGVVPALFRAAARAPGMGPGAGIAAVTGTGYVGFLAGPPVIGLLADAVGLRAALAVPVGLVALVALGSASAFRRAQASPTGSAPRPVA